MRSKASLVGLLLAVVGCSSDPSSGTANTGNNTVTPTNTCGSTLPTAIYQIQDTTLGGLAVDDQSLYFVQNVNEVSKIPKAGGTRTQLAKASASLWLPRLNIDGNTLYFTNGDHVYALDAIVGGTPTTLANTASSIGYGISSILAIDSEFIYFGDDVQDDNGTPQGTVNRVPKAGGAVTVLASGQAGPGYLAMDDTSVYWINDGTTGADHNSLKNGGIGSVSKTGGTPNNLFTMNSSGTGIWPTFDLVLSDTDIYFSSANLDDVANSGGYKIAKSGGTPTRFSDYSTLDGFILNGSTMYINNGDRIAKFNLATGTRTDLVCFPSATEGSVNMTHDGTNIYYIKMEKRPSGATDTPYSIYSIPL